MPNQEKGGQLRWLSPASLLLGVVGSFVGCTLAGRIVAAQNVFPRFVRFYKEISPESLYYPTAHQVRALAHGQLDRDKVAVIVGGNSILRGFGQVRSQVWTRYLQDELGEDYRVLNLAQNGAYPLEFGGTAAEILARDFPKLIFLTDMSLRTAGPPATLPTGAREACIPQGSGYDYFFWEAYFKGLVPADSRRRAGIASRLAERGRAPAFQEQIRGLRVDALTYSRDLWTSLAAARCSTIWVRQELALPPFTRPRRSYPDLDGRKLPPEHLRSAAYIAPIVADLRAQAAHSKAIQRLALNGPLLEGNELLFLPAGLRGRTLILVLPYSPSFVARLTPDEQADYRAGQALIVRELGRIGIDAIESGVGFTAEDYADCDHPAESGGRKQAAEVAPAVRRLARRLGYVRAGEPVASRKGAHAERH